jgi:hypothetical protein
MNRTPAWRVILCGGLIIGTLDGIAAIVNAGLHGVGFVRLWQYVASGLLGRASFQGGAASTALGVFLEFFIGTCVMACYYVASRKVPALVRYAVIAGIVYGVCVFFFMNKLVVPFSAAPAAKGPPVLSRMMIEIMIHIFFVGLPAALVTRFFSGRAAPATLA